MSEEICTLQGLEGEAARTTQSNLCGLDSTDWRLALWENWAILLQDTRPADYLGLPSNS